MLPQVAPGADVVVAARQETAEIDFCVLQAAIKRALTSEGLLSGIDEEDAG